MIDCPILEGFSGLRAESLQLTVKGLDSRAKG